VNVFPTKFTRAVGCQICILLTLLSFHSPLRAASPQTTFIPYSTRAWQTDEGLPQNSIHAIAQTADGFLWVGTEDGLARFDGVRFTLFDDARAPQLRHASITALLAAPTGDLWIGTVGGGLTRWREGKLDHWSKTNGLPDNNIRCLKLGTTGSLWAGTDQGLIRMCHESITVFQPPKDLPDHSVNAICEDEQGVIRVASRTGMWSLDPQGNRSAENFGLGPIRYGLKTIYAARNGLLWFGGSGGLRYARVSEAHPQIRSTGLRQQIITTLLEDSLGQCWVGTLRGVVRMRDDQVVDWPLNEQSPGDAVSAIFEDREGSIWIGGRDGLYRLTPARFVNYTTRQGLIANDVMSVCEDKTGALWIAAGSAG